MKKKICLLLCLLLLCTLALPAVAAGSEPKITLQPQNYHYPQYSVAIYTVKAEGQTLHATWYLSYEGKTYNLSDNQNSFEPWEAYAGENYGPMEQGPNTFSWFFGGIEDGLNGAEIWCIIEDGHYDVTSQRAIITVQGSAMPPEILQMPASLTVNRGAEAELRCVARSNSDAQLCFQWYETATGKLWDIRALDGEDSDYIFCSTESPGTRYYVCCVSDSNGGLVYSSVVPVTVLDSEPQGNPPTLITKTLPKGTVGEDYGFTLEADDYAAEFSIAYNPGGANDFEKTGLKLSIEGMMMGRLKAAGTYTFTVCVANQYGEGYGVLTLEVVDSTSQDEVPTTTPETTAETTPETTTTLNTSPAATPTAPPATTPAATQPQTPDAPDISAAFPWWGYLLIVLGGIVTGIGIAFIFVKLKKKT